MLQVPRPGWPIHSFEDFDKWWKDKVEPVNRWSAKAMRVINHFDSGQLTKSEIMALGDKIEELREEFENG